MTKFEKIITVMLAVALAFSVATFVLLAVK